MILIDHNFVKLIHFVGRVSKSMIISDIVKELLGVQSSAQQQGQISIGSLDDISDKVYGLGTSKRILVRELILDAVSQYYPLSKHLCDLG